MSSSDSDTSTESSSDSDSDFSSSEEDDGGWHYVGGFGALRESTHLPPKVVGPTFEDEMNQKEAEQLKIDQLSHATSSSCRELMEDVAVQIAKYELLHKKNKRACRAEDEFQFYEIPSLYVVAPIMTEEIIRDLLAKNKLILDEAVELTNKNEQLALYEKMKAEDFASVSV